MNQTSTTTPLQDSKLIWRRRQIIALLVFGFLMAAVLMSAIAYRGGGFWRWATVYFVVDDANGLSAGAAVRMSGFRVGRVSALELQPDLTVRVELSIEKELFAKLRSDARADLVREELRPTSIVLRPGTQAAPLSAEDPRVGFRHRGGLADVAEDLRSRLAPILDDLRQFTSLARDRRGDIEALLQNARVMTQELAGSAQQLNRLASDVGQRTHALGGQAEQSLAELNRSLGRVGNLLGEADRSLGAVSGAVPGLLNRVDGLTLKADGLLVQFEGVMRDTRTISAAAAGALPAVLQGVPPLVDDSRELLQGARQVWPLSVFVPSPALSLLPIDSGDNAVARKPAKP